MNLLSFFLASPKERVKMVFGNAGVNVKVNFPDGDSVTFQNTSPDVTLTFHSWKPLRGIPGEYKIAKAYVKGEIDIEGDFLQLAEVRRNLPTPPAIGEVINFWIDIFVRDILKLNKHAIDYHYSFGHDFYLNFLAKKYPAYSQCIYPTGMETLQQATTNKMRNMYKALDLKPGMRLLDIGGGWGCVMEYCCPRGVHVTSLTLGEDSRAYMNNLIKTRGYKNAQVFLQDFMTHKTEQPYDAIVIFGVMEHLPRYRKVIPLLWDILKAQGRIFFDFSAGIFKYSSSKFALEYVWPGRHSYVCLPEFLSELLYHGFEVLRVQNERRDYYHTMREWAHRFRSNRKSIVAKAGEEAYRIFALYLAVTASFMEDYHLQAYHTLVRRREDSGLRPGNLVRFKSFLTSLR